MTTLVIVRKDDDIVIAADSLTTFGDTRLAAEHDRTYDKIVAVSRHLYRPVRIGRAPARVRKPARRQEPLDFSDKFAIFETFRKLHPILKEQHFLNPKEEEDDPYESTQITALIANRARHLRRVLDARSVRVHAVLGRRARAREFALGAMQALYPRLGTAEEVARAGVEAGARSTRTRRCR